VLVQLVVAVAWAGAGRSSASPWLVHSVAAVSTAIFVLWLASTSRRLQRERAHRAAPPVRGARILQFPSPDARRMVTVVALALLTASARAHAYARLSPPDSRTAFAVRAEYYDHPDGTISRAPNLILKLEGRYGRSSSAVFAREALGDDGTPLRKRNQFLVLLGAVAAL